MYNKTLDKLVDYSSLLHPGFPKYLEFGTAIQLNSRATSHHKPSAYVMTHSAMHAIRH